MIFPEDYPRRAELLPRALAGHVMAQVEDPASLARWDEPRLPADHPHPDPLRAADLRRHRAPLRLRRPRRRRRTLPALLQPEDETRGARPRRRRAGGPDHRPAGARPGPLAGRDPGPVPPARRRTSTAPGPVSSGTYREALYRWLEDCDVRDEHGQPVHLTPHQWRHTLGTVLINRDVPQHVVQKILDHDSPLMTAHYARLSDKTVREHWEKARKVNAAGPARPDQPRRAARRRRLVQAAAVPGHPGAAERLLRASPGRRPARTQTRCLTCPMFVTTAEFLPQHHAQRQQTLQIITAAEAAGHARVAEMNKQVAANLDKIIATLEDGRARREGGSRRCVLTRSPRPPPGGTS